MKPSENRLSAEAIYDQRKALVKDMMAKENAVRDANTARLKALRLANDAAAPPQPPAAKGRRKRASRFS